MHKTMNTTDQRQRQAAFVTWASVAMNVVLSLVKFVVGLISGSAAMLADAFHSASDFATDFAVLIGMRLAQRPQDHDHPYGHGKYETLAAVIIGVALCGVGIAIAWQAGRTIYGAIVYGAWPEAPSLIAIWAGLISIAIKEVLYQWTARVARRIQSDALLANAWHHRSDALTSIAAVLGIAAAACLGGRWVLLDATIAIFIGLVLVYIAWKIIQDSIDKLLEQGMSIEENNRILEIINSVPDAIEPHHLRSRRVGTVAVIEMHFRVNPQMTVAEGHVIASKIEALLYEAFGNDAILTLHVEPIKQKA
ncbi:MAG: cation diffusion facilitator family transporter [bacterium]|nr:cation diffusion facilitator family transporter [bacterium]